MTWLLDPMVLDTDKPLSTRRRKRRRTAENRTSLFYYDNLRREIEALWSNGTTDRIEAREDSTVVRFDFGEAEDSSSIRLIHIPCMVGFSRFSAGKTLDGLVTTAKAIIMAQYHFNNRIESVIPNLRELLTDKQTGKECDVHMTLDFYDTGREAGLATRMLVEHVQSRGFPYEASAVMGAVRSAVSGPLAVLNTVGQTPQGR